MQALSWVHVKTKTNSAASTERHFTRGDMFLTLFFETSDLVPLISRPRYCAQHLPILHVQYCMTYPTQQNHITTKYCFAFYIYCILSQMAPTHNGVKTIWPSSRISFIYQISCVNYNQHWHTRYFVLYTEFNQSTFLAG